VTKKNVLLPQIIDDPEDLLAVESDASQTSQQHVSNGPSHQNVVVGTSHQNVIKTSPNNVENEVDPNLVPML